MRGLQPFALAPHLTSYVRHPSTPMKRLLLALCLYSFAAAAMAAGSAANCTCPDVNAKTGKPATVNNTQDCDPTVTAAAPAPAVVATPVRSAAPRVGLPRWHSLLPGMIR